VLSGWDDGKIRAFYPQSGKLMFVINDAHIHGVTALTSTSDCQHIVSGGMEGEVRVWKITRQHQTMQASMKEHRNRVWAIMLRSNNEQAVSCSSDGSCIIWDLKTYTRYLCFLESTLFKQVLFHPDESQILTAGSDRKICYWGTFDGQIIRMLDGSETGEINALSITKEGDYFCSGGEDKIVK
jgi:WD40 repeat protein